MTCIYVAHLENGPGAPVENDRLNSYGRSWVELCGLKLSGDQPRGSNRRLGHRELDEFGLIDVTDPEGRRNGKLKPGQKSGDGLSTYRMHYPPKVQTDFSKPAFDVVMDKLKASAIPPRLLD